jgi:limonene-1,2-epoxide hydrolase
MGAQQEAVVRSWIDCVIAQDLASIGGLYADDATYHVNAWRPPVVGRNAIRAEIARQFDVASGDEITVLSIFSTEAVVFYEAVDNFKYGDNAATLHWASVWEIDPSGKITAQRDYWDAKELETRSG